MQVTLQRRNRILRRGCDGSHGTIKTWLQVYQSVISTFIECRTMLASRKDVSPLVSTHA
jgi:hypothetical protein